MKLNVKAPISTSIAIGVGLIVLIGYFVKIELLENLRNVFIHWAVVLSAVALLMGIINLSYVHIKKISTQDTNIVYSVIILISLTLTLVITMIFGPTGDIPLWIYNNIQFPIEASLLAFVAVILIYSCVRLFKRGISLFAIVFVLTTLVVLVGMIPILEAQIPGLFGPDGFVALIAQIPSVGGARGILIGVALGAIATGLRVLIGADRPYSG
jgi:hypothetical protein